MDRLTVSWVDHGREPKCAPDPRHPDGIHIDTAMGQSRWSGPTRGGADMTGLDLEQLRAKAEAASSGPCWRIASGQFVEQADTSFIAAFNPSTALALIERVEELDRADWRPISTYPRDVDGWGPEVLVRMPPTTEDRRRIRRNGVLAPPFKDESRYIFVAHLEASMWLCRDCDDPYAWAELWTEPEEWRPLNAARAEKAESETNALKSDMELMYSSLNAETAARIEAAAERDAARAALATIAGGMTNDFPGAPDVMTAESPAAFRSAMWTWSQACARAALAQKDKTP